MVNCGRRLDAIFAALADPTRRRIVERLAKGSMSVGAIAAGFPVSQPAISRHVRILEQSGLLERRVNGRVHQCSVAPDAIGVVSEWVDRQRAFWSATLDRLGETLHESPRKREKTK